MNRREREIRREWIRGRILSEAWASAFPTASLSFVIRRAFAWFVENKVSFGLFASWPSGDRDDPVGVRAGVFSAESSRRLVVVGWARLGRADLQRLADHHRVLHVRVIGWLRIADDVDPSLTATTLDAVRVLGVSRVPASVRAQLASRAA